MKGQYCHCLTHFFWSTGWEVISKFPSHSSLAYLHLLLSTWSAGPLPRPAPGPPPPRWWPGRTPAWCGASWGTRPCPASGICPAPGGSRWKSYQMAADGRVTRWQQTVTCSDVSLAQLCLPAIVPAAMSRGSSLKKYNDYFPILKHTMNQNGEVGIPVHKLYSS